MRYALMESKQLLNFAVSKVFLPISKLKCSSIKHVSRRFCISLKTNDKLSSKQRQKLTSQNVPSTAKTDTADCFLTSPFDEMVACRRRQAKSSVVIQVADRFKSAHGASQVCSQHGSIKNIFHYQIASSNSKPKELLLVEFDSDSSVNSLIQSCSHNDNVKVIPSVSPFLWLRALPSAGGSSSQDKSLPQIISDEACEKQNLHEMLLDAKSMSEQMQILEKHKTFSETAQRLRWITCIQVEKTLSGLFPNVQVCPFGSSVNGCGHNGSDLDVILSLDGYNPPTAVNMTTAQSPLVFQAKPVLSDLRMQTKRHLELVSGLLKYFSTGCIQIMTILQARVPIIKFYHEFTGLDCDLSMTNMSGVYMSEMLYLFGEIDSRFRTLVTTVRFWASANGLTNPIPGPYITNFQLSLLVVFYLQRCSPPILPTLNEMMSLARPQVDRRWIDDVECTFLRDPNPFCQRAQLNKSSLEDLFVGFLEFISTFNFNEQALSIIWGKPLRKPELTPIYVQNPMERELNVCKNVSIKEVTRITMAARNAIFDWETQDQGSLRLLVSTFSKTTASNRTSHSAVNDPRKFQLSIQDLFQSEVEEETHIEAVKPTQTTKTEIHSTVKSLLLENHNANSGFDHSRSAGLNSDSIVKNLFVEKREEDNDKKEPSIQVKPAEQTTQEKTTPATRQMFNVYKTVYNNKQSNRGRISMHNVKQKSK